MLFSEIYSAYYNTVASIIACAQKGRLDSDMIYKIVRDSAFPESVMTIGSSLESGKWPLVKKDYSTNIKETPTMPLSLLQKRWLKAVLADKRVRLFADDEILERLAVQLEGVEPLFTENDFYLYDKYSDGDPYEDEGYIKTFRTVAKAIHRGLSLKLEYTGRFSRRKRFFCRPYKIEYSEKDDKFRVLAKIKSHNHSRDLFLNIARINACEAVAPFEPAQPQSEDCGTLELEPDVRSTHVTLEIYDDRKALERVMLAFAHFEKSAVQVSENIYRLTLNYDSTDETELVVRVLSFGPMVKVIEPESFTSLVRDRIFRQMELMKKE